MAKFSSGLRNKMLDTNSMKSIMAAGFLKIYSGTAPADADAALTGTLITTISIASSGVGINFAAAAAAGVLAKLGSETWSGINGASATATHFRHVASGDTGALSTTEARIQGTCALAGGDLNLTNLSLVASNTQVIDFYNVALPTL